MKKMIIAVSLVLVGAATAQADPYIQINKGIRGLLMGAGGGAIAGQIIGRNTESTLVGTAVGTMLGYMVGNEMDKNVVQSGVTGYRPDVNPAYRQPRDGYRYGSETYTNYRYYPENCQEIEILGTVHGAPQKLFTLACQTPQGWTLVSPQRDTDADYRYGSQDQYGQNRSNYPYRQPIRYQY